MEPFNKYGILLQDCMIYPIFNAGGAVKNKIQARLTKALISALLGSLLVPLTIFLAPNLATKANADAPGSISMTSTGTHIFTQTGPQAGNTSTNNAILFNMPAGSQIYSRESYIVETWIKTPSPTGGFSFGGSNGDGFYNNRAAQWTFNSGSIYDFVGGDTQCNFSGTFTAPANTWVDFAMQRKYNGTTSTNDYLFIGGKLIASCDTTSYNNSYGNTTGIPIIKIGPFSGSSNTSYVGQTQVLAGSQTPLYPVTGGVGTQEYSPSLTFSNQASTLLLFQPTASACTTATDPAVSISFHTATTSCSSDAPTPPPPAFTYQTPTLTATAGTAITADTVNSSGGQIDSFTVSPSLPSGLSLNTTTGSITGTPASYSPTATYVITGTQASSGLTTTASIVITVNKPPTAITIALANGTVQVGVIDTITATTSAAGTVSFQTDLGVIPSCSAVVTIIVASANTATCPWNPTSTYYTMNATLTPSSSLLAASTSNPALTNIRGSLSLTSTGVHSFPDGSGNTPTNNALLLNFPTGTGLITGQNFTMETWVKSSSSYLTMQLSAVYGDSVYPDRGQGFQIYNNGSTINGYASLSYMGSVTPSVAIAAGTWQNIVFQRSYVAGQANQSFDTLFINGQVVAQWADGGFLTQYPGGGKSTGIKIGPFGGVTLIGPTQVVADTALYPVSGFAPSTTYSLGTNTLALFQPSSTTCNSAAVAPASVTATYQTTSSSCSSDFPTATPVVTSVVANSGPAAGGNSVVINGNNLVGLSAVKFGNTTLSGSNYAVNTFGTQITATVPAGTGSVDVTVSTTLGGTSALTANDVYTYLVAPTVTSVSPATGSTSGGSSVVIAGTGFTSTSAVTFGTVAATSFTVNSATQITATVPAGSAGTCLLYTSDAADE